MSEGKPQGRWTPGRVPIGASMRHVYETLSWALDLLDLYDERLSGIDGPSRVYTEGHVQAKARARRCLDGLAEMEENARAALDTKERP